MSGIVLFDNWVNKMGAKILLDTRNQKDSFVEKALKQLGYDCIRSKLPFGDVALSTNILKCVDIKASGGGLIEVANNFCSKDHARVRREILSCFQADGEITFLCFEPNMTCLEDILKWNVPRFKSDAWQTKYLIDNKWLTNKEIQAKELDITGSPFMRVKLHSKGDPMTKLSPVTLYKVLKTITAPNRYMQGKTVKFAFTTAEKCGEDIVKFLTT